MGRRNYYCEYCDKRFKDDAQIRKKHLDGLQHKSARNEHYAKYKGLINIIKRSKHFVQPPFFFRVLDPIEILRTEMRKIPCSKFQTIGCNFGATCRFSHYTAEQLAALQLHGNSNKVNYKTGSYCRVFLQ